MAMLRPVPSLPDVPRTNDWRGLAEGYATMASTLYAKWQEQEQERSEVAAQVLVLDANAKRQAELLEKLQGTVDRLARSVDKLTARLNGEELEEAAAGRRSKHEIEAIAGAVAEQVEEVLEEVTSRHQLVPPAPAVPTITSDRVVAIIEDQHDKMRLNVYDWAAKRALDAAKHLPWMALVYGGVRMLEFVARGGHW